MKKVLVFLLACLSSTLLLAQTHWTQITTGPGVAGGNTSLTGELYIDHVAYYNGDQTPEFLEIGVFDQDEVCRAAKLPSYRANKDQWVYQLVIKGGEGFEYHFKIYDHATETETDLVDDFGEVITWGSGKKYGSLSNPYELNFTNPNAEPETFYKPIYGWGDNTETGNYYLIASPIGSVAPANVTNMIADPADNYDLYAWDGTSIEVDNSGDTLVWRNFKVADNNLTNLEAGKGYLYANANNVTLEFTGVAYTGTGNFSLNYDSENANACWNLMGNPFADTAYVDKSFLVMKDDGTGFIVADRNYVEPMEGCFIQATVADQTVTFSTDAPEAKRAMLSINVCEGRGVADRAIVRFGGDHMMSKFQFNQNSTQVYIPMDGKDYAVVSAPEMGEMPVNFKTENNGTYSLVFNAEEVSFNYLHLIDNMTGADVDLLVNPSYSFDALTTDYASRFKLVFATGNNNDDSFAFFSNGNFIISNEGEATLQVVDVTGRILSSENINGSASVNVNAATGVYMLRLINGNDVKVQKVIVK